MPAYLMTNIGPDSRATPDAGITATRADDGTLKYRRDQSDVHYDVRLVHHWVTLAEFNALTAFVVANGYGPHTFTLAGTDYSGTLLNMPAELEHRGSYYMVESRFLATAV